MDRLDVRSKFTNQQKKNQAGASPTLMGVGELPVLYLFIFWGGGVDTLTFGALCPLGASTPLTLPPSIQPEGRPQLRGGKGGGGGDTP